MGLSLGKCSVWCWTKKKISDRQSVMPQACKWVYSAEARKICYRIVTVYFFIRAFLATWLSNNFCLSVCIIMVRTSCRISAQYSIFAVYVAQSTCALQIWIMYVHRQTCEREKTIPPCFRDSRTTGRFVSILLLVYTPVAITDLYWHQSAACPGCPQLATTVQ